MAVHITGLNADTEKPATLHLLPCTIEHTGPAKVDSFFKSSICSNGEGLSATFRGRELRGKLVSIPEGYTGLVLQEPNRPFTEDQDRHLKISSKFDSFTYWNLQTPPSDQDKLVRALQWAKLSSVIHAPVSDTSNTDSPNSVEFSRWREHYLLLLWTCSKIFCVWSVWLAHQLNTSNLNLWLSKGSVTTWSWHPLTFDAIWSLLVQLEINVTWSSRGGLDSHDLMSLS